MNFPADPVQDYCANDRPDPRNRTAKPRLNMDPRRLLRCLALAVVAPTCLCACGHGDQAPAAQDKATSTVSLTSPAFVDNAAIPARFTCDGANISPPLRWAAPPQGTKSLALTCDDSDAPAGDWTHWVIYNLPPTATSLPEAVTPTALRPDGVRQCRNSFGKVGYGGPCPPSGNPHHYIFRLYALDAELSLTEDATAADAQRAAGGHVLAEGTLTGTYGRQ